MIKRKEITEKQISDFESWMFRFSQKCYTLWKCFFLVKTFHLGFVWCLSDSRRETEVRHLSRLNVLFCLSVSLYVCLCLCVYVSACPYIFLYNQVLLTSIPFDHTWIDVPWYSQQTELFHRGEQVWRIFHKFVIGWQGYSYSGAVLVGSQMLLTL